MLTLLLKAKRNNLLLRRLSANNMATKPKKWIQGMHMKKGALHKEMGVPMDKKIPAGKLKTASNKGGKLGQRARLAMTLKKMH